MKDIQTLDLIKSGKLFNDIINNTPDTSLSIINRKVPRTRDNDMTESLSFKVYDPLWMLMRQWQLGEFRGNDAGTAMSVSCKVVAEDCQSDPIEPVTEQVNPDIDLMARVQSAMYFLDLLRASKKGVKISDYISELKNLYPVDFTVEQFRLDPTDANTTMLTEDIETAQDTQRKKFLSAYKDKTFDGYKLYQALSENKSLKVCGTDLSSLKSKYVTWFEKRYLPAKEGNSHWNASSMNYTVEVDAGKSKMTGDRYQGGRVSWHTVDATRQNASMSTNVKETAISAIPSPANYPGAPNKRLWQFEDKKVFLGNSADQQSKGNEMFLKYATMYSNDWMLIPLQTEIGKLISVKEIRILDSFGAEETVISGNNRAGANDMVNKNEEKWQMFTNSYKGENNGESLNKLFMAPQIRATIEGKPIEEIRFLRDEMANMIWGVETKISSGCGSVIDEEKMAVTINEKLQEAIDANRPETKSEKVRINADGSSEKLDAQDNKSEKAAFKYALQSSVPLNWIPFVPQHIDSNQSDIFFMSGRETALRRGKMPWYVLDVDKQWHLYAARPMSSFLRSGIENGKETPLFINEEEIQKTGILLKKNYQRCRWLNGKTYLWLGMYKQLSSTDRSSGLEFGKLTEND